MNGYLNNYAQPVAHSEDCKLARRYRQDTLYILKNLSLTRIPGSVSELFEQGQQAVEAVPGLSEAIGQAVACRKRSRGRRTSCRC